MKIHDTNEHDDRHLDPAVAVRGLLRTYRSGRGAATRQVIALDRIDLSVYRGEVHGLLGPNGAGKTTLCKILSTVLLPTAGSAEILGHNVATDTDAVKRAVGVVFGGDRGLYGRISGRANLNLWAALYGLKGRALSRRVSDLLDRFGLGDRAQDRVDSYSRGMKQRLHLARGLVSNPRVLILDEPTTGMDPVAAHDFREMVSGLCAEGRTILLTTHDMAEAEALCDRVTLIDHGRVLATERPSALALGLSAVQRVEALDVPDPAIRRIRDLDGVISVDPIPGSRVRIDTAASVVTAAVLDVLLRSGVSVLATVQPNLEDAYLHLIGQRGMAVDR